MTTALSQNAIRPRKRSEGPESALFDFALRAVALAMVSRKPSPEAWLQRSCSQ
jgi:hypothetical protein